MEIRCIRQTDLAEMTRISKSKISMYVNGSHEPRSNNIYLLAEALNVQEAWLLGYDVPMEKNSIGQRIHQLRLNRGMSLESLAKMIGVGKSTVRKWEIGMIENMRQDKIEKIANALNVNPGYLMGWGAGGIVGDRSLCKSIGLTQSDEEQYMLNKYRALDEYGRRMVDIVLELEWERCTQGEE